MRSDFESVILTEHKILKDIIKDEHDFGIPYRKMPLLMCGRNMLTHKTNGSHLSSEKDSHLIPRLDNVEHFSTHTIPHGISSLSLSTITESLDCD